MSYSTDAQTRFETFTRALKSSEAEYARECWDVFRMTVDQDILLTFDMEDHLPPLPFNVNERQGYMIRQTLLDLAIHLDRESNGGG